MNPVFACKNAAFAYVAPAVGEVVCTVPSTNVIPLLAFPVITILPEYIFPVTPTPPITCSDPVVLDIAEDVFVTIKLPEITVLPVMVPPVFALTVLFALAYAEFA